MRSLSLQGSMAVGKTTALQYLASHMETIHISYEQNRHIIEQINEQGLNKREYVDYVAIQRLFINNEIERYKACRNFEWTIMDYGAEEIEFYTLNYPKTLEADWDMSSALEKELAALRACMPERILYLDAQIPVLKERKGKDTQRSRTFLSIM